MVNIIKEKTSLIFNYSNEIFIENLSNKIKLFELEDAMLDDEDIKELKLSKEKMNIYKDNYTSIYLIEVFKRKNFLLFLDLFFKNFTNRLNI